MLTSAMKFLFVLTIAVLIAVTLYADYRWKQWMKANREARDRERDQDRSQDRGLR